MAILALSLFAFLLIGMPIAAAFALVAFLNAERLGIWLDTLSNIPYESVTSFALAAIPLFILVGELMKRSGLARALAFILDRVLRRVRAAFGYIMIGASAFMGAITGSSVATVAAIGAVVGPEMKMRGYPRGYVAALNAAAGLLGVLVPPSIPLILYGSTVGVSITQLFLATLLPGMVMILAFALVHRFISRRVLESGRESIEVGTARTASPGQLQHGVAALFLPVLVLGGIYGGFFTPTEAAAVACLYALMVAVVQRSIPPKGIAAAFYSAAIPSAAILLIIAMTGVLNRALVLNQVPQDLAAHAATLFADPLLFLITVNLLLFVVGMFMETNAAVLLMGPLLAPSAAAFGIDPIHFAIIVVTNIEIGLLTPPLAANLYVAARTNDVPLTEMLRYFGWFLAAAVIVLLLITYVPAISLWYTFL